MLSLVEYAAVSHAVSNIATLLEIPATNLAQLLDTSPYQVDMYLSGVATPLLERTENHCDLVDLVRMYRALFSILPENHQARAWMNGENSALQGVPLDLISSREGLRAVVGYLEAQSC